MTAALVALCFLPICTRCYDIPREALLCVCAVFAAVTLTCLPACIPLAVMLLWWVVNSCQAVNAHVAKRHLAICVSTVIVGWCAVHQWEILIGASLINVFIAILQRFGVPVPHSRCIGQNKRRMFEKTDGIYKNRPPGYPSVGMIGNTNYFGLYLVPHFFLSLHLAQSCYYWYAAAAVIALGLQMSYCRVAQIATAFGLAYMLSPGLAVIVLVCGVYVFRKKETLAMRIQFFKDAIRQIVKTPFAGVGFNCYKVVLPEIIKERRAKYGEPKIKVVPPRRCHNEYLQHILDNGAVSLCLFLYIVYCALCNSGGFIHSGIIACLVCGLGFHVSYVLPMAVVLWAMIFSSVQTVDCSIWYIAPVLLLMAMPVIRYLIADIYFTRWIHGKGKIDKAVQHCEYRNEILWPYAYRLFKDKKYVEAFMVYVKMFVNYDGFEVYYPLAYNIASFTTHAADRHKEITQWAKEYEGF